MQWTPIGPEDASLSPEVPPAVGQNRDGRLEVFAIDRSMRLVHTWEVASNTGQFAPWEVLPHRDDHKFSDSLALARNGDGRLEVFAHAAYIHDIFHVWQTSPNNGWSEITPMGGSQLYRVQAAANADGRQPCRKLRAVGRGLSRRKDKPSMRVASAVAKNVGPEEPARPGHLAGAPGTLPRSTRGRCR